MATPVIMPRQGQSVESCIIGKWHKQLGDTVKAGDILFTYETDKATFDEAAKVDGTILAVFFAEGDDVPCLLNVCVIGQPGESFAEFDPNGAGAGASEAVASAAADTSSAAETAKTAAAVRKKAPQSMSLGACWCVGLLGGPWWLPQNRSEAPHVDPPLF